MIPNLISLALPIAVDWVKKHQAIILRDGVPLSDQQCADAQQAGVKNPKLVRLLKVDVMPMPTDPVLLQANEQVHLVSPATAGISYGYGIYIRSEMWDRRPLVVHELVHVAQFERYGDPGAFLKAYITECLTIGYPNGPLEREAINLSTEICKG